MAIFAPFFFLGYIGHENVFRDILQEINGFLPYKDKKFTQSKNWHNSKGVNAWFFVQKWHFFELFFKGNMGQENVFYDILERKIAFLG